MKYLIIIIFHFFLVTCKINNQQINTKLKVDIIDTVYVFSCPEIRLTLKNIHKDTLISNFEINFDLSAYKMRNNNCVLIKLNHSTKEPINVYYFYSVKFELDTLNTFDSKPPYEEIERTFIKVTFEKYKKLVVD